MILLVAFFSFGCEEQANFKPEALSQELISLNGEAITFGKVLERYKEKPILIDVWASWCSDCIKGMPKVHQLQKEYDLVYMFLSYDKNETEWKAGIEKYNVQGENFLIQSAWKGGKFREYLDISWIPRYIVVAENGKIALYNVIEADDPKLIEVIKTFKK